MPDGGNLIGLGAYTVPEAARLAELHPSRVRSWAFGRGGDAIVAPDLSAMDGQEAISFLALAEVVFVRELRAAGLKWSTIRAAKNTATRLFPALRHPFAANKLHTDGLELFLEVQSSVQDAELIRLTDGNGAMLAVLVRSFRRSFRFDGPDGLASLWHPRESLSRVVVDPRRHFGRPIDDETSVPVDVLSDALLAEKGDAERVARLWSVPTAAVDQAAEFTVFANRRMAA